MPLWDCMTHFKLTLIFDKSLWRWHDIFQAISCEASMTVLSILYIFMFFLCGQAWHFLYILCVFLVNKHGICVFLMFCVSSLWTIMTALSILYISYIFIMELAWQFSLFFILTLCLLSGGYHDSSV